MTHSFRLFLVYGGMCQLIVMSDNPQASSHRDHRAREPNEQHNEENEQSDEAEKYLA